MNLRAIIFLPILRISLFISFKMDQTVFGGNLFLIRNKTRQRLVCKIVGKTTRELVENFWNIYEVSVEYHWHALPINRLVYAAYGNITNIAHCLFFSLSKNFYENKWRKPLFSNSTIFLLSIDEASDKRTYTIINTIVKYSLDNLKTAWNIVFICTEHT